MLTFIEKGILSLVHSFCDRRLKMLSKVCLFVLFVVFNLLTIISGQVDTSGKTVLNDIDTISFNGSTVPKTSIPHQVDSDDRYLIKVRPRCPPNARMDVRGRCKLKY